MDVEESWNENHDKAIQAIKLALTSYPVLRQFDPNLDTQAQQAHRQATHVDTVYSPLSTLPVAEIEARLAIERAQRVVEKPRAGRANNKIPKDGGLRLASRALQAVRTERPQTPRLDKSEITYQ